MWGYSNFPDLDRGFTFQRNTIFIGAGAWGGGNQGSKIILEVDGCNDFVRFPPVVGTTEQNHYNHKRQVTEFTW